MKKVLHRESTRGKADFGWLQANYSFSFANYYDPQRLQFGLLRVLNDDYVAPKMGFGKHPHKNMEIVTIPQSGSLRHEDSMGNSEIIYAGEIQLMSAGSGVEHSELNASNTEPVKLFQIWIFPDTENVEPRYQQKKIAPLLVKNKLTAIIKPKNEAKENELWIHQNAYFNLGDFSETTEIVYKLNKPNHGAYIFVINGSLSTENEILEKRDALGVWDFEEIKLKIEKDSRILIIEVPLN